MIFSLCMTCFCPYFHVEQDQAYGNILNIPQTGLNLKTKIYVAVKATNLTER